MRLGPNILFSFLDSDSGPLADFGMARAYSPRPLTPGTVTIWYRAPELLLGTKFYTPSVDLWSAGLVLAELLLCTPCLTGETAVEQLSLTVKLIGSPTGDDLAALSAIGCPDLIRWRRVSLVAGRADNLERKFLTLTSAETVNVLKGFLKWDPHARLTAAEALGIGKSRCAVAAQRWWQESPRAIDKGLLPTFPEVRNADAAKSEANRGRIEIERLEGTTSNNPQSGDYIFDFGDQQVRRPTKRPRAN